MAKFKTKGIEEWIANLEKLQDVPRDTVHEIVTAGSAEIADTIRAEIQALPVKTAKGQDYITSVQKAGLLDGFGISPLKEKDDNTTDRRVGFNGYNKQMTHKYPNGQPNVVIARSLCSGTSFRAKNDFFGRGVKKAKKNAEERMKQTLEAWVNETMED